MKNELKAKYLQTLLKKNKNQNAGFTLIELLVVIVIIGILAAVALPTFLNQANKARESEAKSNLGAINRAQQAYAVENRGTYASKFGTTAKDELGIPAPESPTYDYTIPSAGNSKAAPDGDNPDKLKSFCGVASTSAVDVCAAPAAAGS